jgi:long-chain acyl-CoA synthetase
VQSDEGVSLAVGVVGEIAVRGGNVMLGYWNNPDATAAAMRDGWLLTGDIGYGDADGYFFITDRKKDMILVNGSNVYPREIEEVICRFPGVREAAVVGKPDERRGEHPVAFIVAQEGQKPDLQALNLFVRERLADYKKPRHYEILEALPRNATGKVLKTALRAMPLAS